MFNILSHIGSFQLGYTCILYFKYSDTLNTFNVLCFKQSKVIFKGSSLKSVLLSNAKWDTFSPSKYFFLLLSFQFCINYGTCSQNVQATSKLSPQNHFITKLILFLKHFESSIIVIR